VFQQNVNRYESGTTPHTDFLITLAVKENVSMDWLLLGRGKMNGAVASDRVRRNLALTCALPRRARPGGGDPHPSGSGLPSHPHCALPLDEAAMRDNSPHARTRERPRGTRLFSGGENEPGDANARPGALTICSQQQITGRPISACALRSRAGRSPRRTRSRSGSSTRSVSSPGS
jgi:hypothetical protein